jgi:hypothetical protein
MDRCAPSAGAVGLRMNPPLRMRIVLAKCVPVNSWLRLASPCYRRFGAVAGTNDLGQRLRPTRSPCLLATACVANTGGWCTYLWSHGHLHIDAASPRGGPCRAHRDHRSRCRTDHGSDHHVLVGAFPDHFFQVWGLATLFVLAVGLPIAAFQVIFGIAGTVIGAIMFLVIGNPASGGSSARELLPGVWRTLSQILPPGAAVTSVRDVVYFNGYGSYVLAVYAVLGAGWR